MNIDRIPAGARLDRDQMTDELIDHGIERARSGLYEAIAGQLIAVIAIFAAVAAGVAMASGIVATGNCDAIAPCETGGATIALAAGVTLLTLGAFAVFSYSALRVWRAGRDADSGAGKRALKVAAGGIALLIAAGAWAAIFVLAGTDPLPWV